MVITAAKIVDFNISLSVVRVEVRDKLYDVKTPLFTGRSTPDVNKHLAVWLRSSNKDGYMVDRNTPVGSMRMSGGIAFIVDGDEAIHPEIPTGEYPASMLSTASPDVDNAMWIPGTIGSNGSAETGIGVGRDGTIILKSSGGEILMDANGITFAGENLISSTEGASKDKVITIPNPLGFLPSWFALPLPKELPDFAPVVKLVRIVKTMKSLMDV